jgi:hypothetical protein
MRLSQASQGTGHGGRAEPNAGGGFPRRTVLGERGIRCGSDLGQQRRLLIRPNPAMTPWPSPRSEGAGLALLDTPAFDRTDPNTEEAGRLGLREPGVIGSQQPLAEVGGVLLHPEIVTPARLFRNPL